MFDGIDSNRFVYGDSANKTTNVSNVSTALPSGFYDANNATGTPTATWYTYVNARHNNTANNYGSQIACSFYDTQNFYVRNISNGSYGAWAKIWNSSNDGSGSGLDADTVDGIQASSFLRSDANDTTTGTITAAGLSMNGTIDMNGNIITELEDIYLRDKIYHDGDLDTFIGMNTDMIMLAVGNEQTQINTSGIVLTSGIVREKHVSLSGTTPTVFYGDGGSFDITLSGNTTFTFTSATNGYSTGFIIEVTGNGSTITWPTSVDWAGGSAPDAPANGEKDIYVFWTRDGGTTWYGVRSIDAAA